MATEIELKLEVRPGGLQRLRRTAPVHRLKLARPLTRAERTVYFDTPEGELRTLKAVLRVRHIGRRRVQTLKSEGSVLGGAAARGEWEWEISGDQPELAPLQAETLPLPVDWEALIGRLRPVFSTEIRRTVYRLGEADWEVELTLDDGRLVTDTDSQPVSEAELELKRGTPGRLFALARELHQAVPARLAVTSKSARGYALAERQPLPPRKSAMPEMAADISAGAACQTIIGSCLGQLLANHDCLTATSGSEVEAIHQMRVALRRLKSALVLFKPILGPPSAQPFRDELKWLQGQLGPARDADVFIAEILEPAASLFGQDPAYQALRRGFAERRRQAYDLAVAALAAPRFTSLMLEIGAWSVGGPWLAPEDEATAAALAAPARQLAERLLGKRHRKLRKAMRDLRQVDEHTRHQFRIDLKKLRYAIEFFAPLFADRKAKRLASALGAVQDGLGLLNDIAVSRGRLAQLGSELDQAWIAGCLYGWHAARIPDLLDQVEVDWKAYRKEPRFWE